LRRPIFASAARRQMHFQRRLWSIDPGQVGHPHQDGDPVRRRSVRSIGESISRFDVGPSAVDRYDGHERGWQSEVGGRRECYGFLGGAVADPGRAVYRVWLIIGLKHDDLEHYIEFACWVRWGSDRCRVKNAMP